MVNSWISDYKYDIPAFDVSGAWDWVIDFLKKSIHSCADTGFVVVGIVIALSLVGIIRTWFAQRALINKGVRKNALSRQIYNTDVKRNLDDIVDHKVKQMEVNFLSKNRYHQKNFAFEVQDKINSMQVNYAANKEFNNNSKHYKAQADNYYKKRKGK